jgi:hypothetical protein
MVDQEDQGEEEVQILVQVEQETHHQQVHHKVIQEGIL